RTAQARRPSTQQAARAALLKGILQIDARRLKCGRDTEQDAGDERGPQGKGEHAPVEPDIAEQWSGNETRADAQKSLRSPGSQTDTEKARQNRQNDAFRR